MSDRPPRILRLCSVFEPPAGVLNEDSRRLDPIGGMQNHTAELTRGLAARGLTQTVVTARPPGAPRRHRFAEGAEVIRLGWNIRHLRQLYSLGAAPLMRKLGTNADLVHVHLGEDLAVVPLGLLAARRNGLPIVMTIHCSPKHTVARTDLRSTTINKLGGWIEERGERASDAIISITWRLAHKIIESGIPRDRVHVIPSGVNPELFAEPTIDPLPRVPRPRIGFVGRLKKSKGIFDLLDAAELLTHDAQLVYVGDGPDRAALESEIRRRDMGRSARVTGFVPHETIPAYLQHLDVLTLPSHYEELGSILIEGMQAGVALVGSDTGGIPELIDDEGTGLLTPPGDPKRLSAALDRLLWDPRLRLDLGEAASMKAPLYDWNELSERVLSVYENVLGRHAAAV